MPLIDRIELQTPRPDALGAFYRDVLGLHVQSDPAGVSIRAGASTLVFSPCQPGTPSVYHFAFGIPPGTITAAEAWLSRRLPLIHSPEGQRRFRFEVWKSDAVYFKDPAGNIAEFIAREAPAAVPAFSPESILSVCEIGIIVPDVPASADDAERSLDARAGWRRYGTPSSDFTAVGDDDGLLIFVAPGRTWYPEDVTPALPAPTTVTIRGRPGAMLQVPGSMCTIRTSR